MSHQQHDQSAQSMRPSSGTRLMPGAGPFDSVSRRAFVGSILGGLAAAFTGCAFKKCELAADTPTPDLINYLNRNIDLTDSWRCDKVSIKLHGVPVIVPQLSAALAIQRPRNFRLQASMAVGGGNLVDLGSNDDKFWFWMRDDKQPAILCARHDCLQQAQRNLPMPFDPEWLMEILGLVPLDPHEIKVEKHPTNLKQCFFRRNRTAPDGSRVELVSTVDTCAGVIIDHSLTDGVGNMIALAHMSEHLRDGKSGIELPHTVDLSWPQAGMGLKLRLGAIEVNPVTLSEKQFTMPKIANCPVYDIGETPEGGKEEIEQAGGDEGKAKV